MQEQQKEQKNPIAIRNEDNIHIYNKNDPDSFINVIPTFLASHVETIPNEFLNMNALSLREDVRPNKTDIALKKMFWREYNRSVLTGTQMRTNNIFNGICARNYFIRRLTTNNKVLAWFIVPEPDIEAKLAMLEDKALERLEEMLEMDVTNKSGGLDPKKGELVLKIAKEVLSRSNPKIHKVEQKSMSVKVDATSKPEDTKELANKIRMRLEHREL